MASVIFDKMLQDAKRKGIANNGTRNSVNWFRQKAMGVSRNSVGANRFLTDSTRTKNIVLPGQMYMFLYDPKGKDSLPFYDRFPLIFPYKLVPGGFYGLNLHYLPPMYRAKLMDALFTDRVTGDGYTDKAKLQINYSILNTTSRYKYFKPCVKHYLSDHVQSKFIYVHPSEWNLALMLPTERFVGATNEQVWTNSKSTF